MPPPVDADADGMADDWEAANGLDAANPGDHATVMASGYTAIEEYVNGLSDQLVGAAPSPAPTDPEPGATVPPVEGAATTIPTPRPASTGDGPRQHRRPCRRHAGVSGRAGQERRRR